MGPAFCRQSLNFRCYFSWYSLLRLILRSLGLHFGTLGDTSASFCSRWASFGPPWEFFGGGVDLLSRLWEQVCPVLFVLAPTISKCATHLKKRVQKTVKKQGAARGLSEPPPTFKITALSTRNYNFHISTWTSHTTQNGDQWVSLGITF